jgi:hypothetical protein
MYKDSNERPYLIITPAGINSSTDNITVTLSIYDPQNGITYTTLDD